MSYSFITYVDSYWIFSYIIRAFSLAIRLSANIMAGHTLVFIISSFISNILSGANMGLYF
jgi:F0F1-type ATP synthase membrane subunit a